MDQEKDLNTISIMQPCFIPWCGYFYLILKSRIFVFLTKVKMQKNSWQTKNKILNKNTELYVNIPISGSRLQNIFEAKIDNNSKWKKKIINTLTQNYSRHPYFELIEDLIITELESKKIIYIYDLNTRIIRKISKNLSIDVDFKNDYDYDFTGKKSEKLKNICNHFLSKNYVSPIGSKEYIESEKILQQSNINVKYLEVINEVQYPQMNNNKFIDNLSIIDVIANTGLAGTLEYLYKKYKLI
tara:strand:+ start:1432 stop:2157 length:726 start_codon:yes stop_codon:yes gene_type:complete